MGRGYLPDIASAAEAINAALQATKAFDEDCGFTWNRGKGARLAIPNAVAELVYDEVGDIKEESVTLGIPLKTNGNKMEAVRDGIQGIMAKDCRKIGIALSGKSQIWRRKKFLRSNVISKLRWSAQWTSPCPVTLLRWGKMIEKCVSGPAGVQKFRSRAAIWTLVIGLDLLPEFVIDKEVFMHQRRLARKGTVEKGKTRLELVLDKWQWKRLGPSLFQTQAGVLDLTFDTKACINNVCMDAAAQALWRAEPRSNDDDSQEWLSNRMPIVEEHRKIAGKACKTAAEARCAIGGLNFGLACGSAFDFRRWRGWNKSQLKHGRQQISTACRCKEREPDRRHFMWECPFTGVHNERFVPKCQTEEAFGLQCVTKPAPPSRRSIRKLPWLVRKMQSASTLNASRG